MAAAEVPAWDATKVRRCFHQFIKMGCVKKGNEDDIKETLGGMMYINNFRVESLDVEMMKAVILDCVAALGIIQQLTLRDEKRAISATQAALNKVFKSSLSIAATEFIRDGTEVPKLRPDVIKLLGAFPVDANLTDGRSWLPLHWTVVTDEKIVTQNDVKLVYNSDPMAMQRYHQQRENWDKSDMGYTPAHLLCMQETTNRNMSLVRHFSICNQQAFTKSASYRNGYPLLYSFSAVHAACGSGDPTEVLLQHLLQLGSSQTKKKCSENGLTPLGYLCKNSRCSDRLVSCLLGVDSSTEVVWNGIVGCLQSTDYECVLERVDVLLKANPEAAKYRDLDGCNALHIAAQQGNLPHQLCIDVMQRIHAIHKDAVREVDKDGRLPVHSAARYSTVEVMEFLLGLYPESESVVTGRLGNLLHLVTSDEGNTTSVVEAKVRFLCSRYPAMMLQKDDEGDTPLLGAICYENIPAVQILCEIGGQEQVRLPVAHPTRANFKYNGWLPLHYLTKWNAGSLRESLLSKEADCFRMLLRLYPEAAGIEGDVDDDDEVEHAPVAGVTPIQLAVDDDLPPYYHRLLLRAAPNLNSAELHRLNYAERRMATILAFRAVSSQPEPLLLARLRFAKMDLVKHVMSFL